MSGLKRSCAYQNLTLETIKHSGDWVNHRIKDQYTKQFLLTLDSSEIVFFTDGYDTLFVANEKEILDKYYQLDSPVVFSTELNCAPYQTFSYMYRDKTSRYRYLNSGGYIGRVGDILNLYKQLQTLDLQYPLLADEPYKWSNQYHWMKLYLYTKNCIKLDTDCTIFQTFPNDLNFKINPTRIAGDHRDSNKLLIDAEIDRIMSGFYFENGRVVNKTTRSIPCHLHFNSVYLKDFTSSPYLESTLQLMNTIEC